MRILVVSPHPDDETLGAGGTLLRYKREGHQIFWINVTSMMPELGYTPEQISRKREQIDKVVNAYGFEEFMNLGLPTTKLELCDSGKMIAEIGSFFEYVQPNVVLLPNPTDAHTDHKIVFNWCYACTKTFRHQSVRKVMIMEIPSETDYGSPFVPFAPNLYVDISKDLKNKLKILEMYEGELGEHPFPRSIRRVDALATVRGGEANVEYAEAFRILKEII